MKQAQFYLLQTAQSGELTSAEALACELAANAWRAKQRVLLVCENEQQAFAMDEALWAREPDSFVPHNLSGESTAYATPIEISWAGKRNAQRRDVLINLQSQLPDFISSFNQIIDFVPPDEEQKALARERYKQLKMQGWQLSTQNA